jgi:hypothetical protein
MQSSCTRRAPAETVVRTRPSRCYHARGREQVFLIVICHPETVALSDLPACIWHMVPSSEDPIAIPHSSCLTWVLQKEMVSPRLNFGQDTDLFTIIGVTFEHAIIGLGSFNDRLMILGHSQIVNHVFQLHFSYGY